MVSDRDSHDFVVTNVETTDDDKPERVSIVLTDERGERVRLHLNMDMAEMLRERVAAALDKATGP